MPSFRVSELQKDIIKTLAYADIFDFPLKDEEIFKWLISSSNIPLTSFKKTLKEMTDKGVLDQQGDYYCLPGKEKNLKTRQARTKFSQVKLILAQKAAQKLSWLPTLKMVGVTGALAMGNCEEDDDIDFIVITAANRLWFSRMILYLISPVLGIKRRKPREKVVKDKICFNLFLDENHLRINPQNLFLAHEICQIKPLLNKDNTYEKFLWENRWVSNFLPNAKNSLKFKVQSSKLERKHPISQSASWRILISLLDSLAFALQYRYMKPKMTSEKVSLHQAFFHPVDLQGKIEEEFEQRLRKVLTRKAKCFYNSTRNY